MSARAKFSNERPGELRGWQVLAILLTFFGLIMGVNGVFVAKALSTFPGEDEANSYVQGVAFNRSLEHRAAQAKLGWTAALGLEANDTGLSLVAQIAGKDGAPLRDIEVAADIRRVGVDDEFRHLAMTASPSGSWRAALPHAAIGRIEVRLSARERGAKEPSFEAEKFLVTP